MKSFTTLFVASCVFLGVCVASPIAELDRRTGKPTGGPASATVTIYSGPYTCSDPSTVPPSDGSAGTVVKSFTISETQCVIVPVPFGGALTATLTAAPKTGTVGCYIETFLQQGCGVVLNNQLHGFPFGGIAVGNQVGCAQVPAVSYGAVEIVCA